MPEPIGTQTNAIAETLAGQAAALHGLFMRTFGDLLSNKERSHRDVGRALKAQAQCRMALHLLVALRAASQTTKNREIERTDYWKRKITIMTKHLDKPPRKAARGQAKRRPKRLAWSPERRARQAELIRALKPWTKSTGPRTAAGKARTAANALKHGFRSRPFIERLREERQLIRDAARTIALAKALFRALDSGAITVWTADPLDAPHLILSSLGRGASDRTKRSAVRSGQGSGSAT